MPSISQSENIPPTVWEYIFHSLFGLGFAFMAVSTIIALFSERERSKHHWGRGRGNPPASKLSLLMALPFCLFVPVRYVVYLLAVVTRHEEDWRVPNWWFFPCIALFFIGGLYDNVIQKTQK